MIVKVVVVDENHMTIRTKPSHSGRDREHAVDIQSKPSSAIMEKLGGKKVVYFHAHLKEDTLVLDDQLEDQRW